MPDLISPIVRALIKMSAETTVSSQAITCGFGCSFLTSETTLVSSRKLINHCPIRGPWDGRRAFQLEIVKSRARQQVALKVRNFALEVAVVGDVNHHGHLTTMTRDKLRSLGMSDPQKFAESLLRILNLPQHLDSAI